jgi:ATP-dependent Clp protease ATP-binding subunit ClpA
MGTMADLIRASEPTPAHEVISGVPKSLSELIQKALRKDPEQRFNTAEEMRDALKRFRTSPDDKVIHRSASLKALFARAEAAAREANEKEVGISCLIKILLAEPDEALAEALAQIGKLRIDARPSADKTVIAWIDSYGCDLTARARKEKIDDAGVESIRRDAVCRVLADVLFASPSVKTPPVLLVSRGERNAAAVINDLGNLCTSLQPASYLNKL